jgi:TolB protein
VRLGHDASLAASPAAGGQALRLPATADAFRGNPDRRTVAPQIPDATAHAHDPRMLQTHITRTHSRLAVVLVVATTVLASAIGVGPGQRVAATPPGINGRISFGRTDSDGHWQIWTANPDLTASQQITDGDYDSASAVWSPDGTRLAFHSPRDDSNHTDAISDIYVMNADGSDVTKLTHSLNWSETPAWSPTGDLIAFSSTNFADPAEQGIYVVRPDGTGMRRVTTPPTGTGRDYYLVSPRFSPDGRSLVYTSIRTGREVPHGLRGELTALYVVAVDGSDPYRITPWGITPGDADWSPDGRQIVFETITQHLGNGASVMVVNRDGTDLHALTKDAGITGIGRWESLRLEASFDPVWSPDGTQIMFSHGLKTSDGIQGGLQVISPDGTGQRWVSDIRDNEHQVDWGTAPLE